MNELNQEEIITSFNILKERIEEVSDIVLERLFKLDEDLENIYSQLEFKVEELIDKKIDEKR